MAGRVAVFWAGSGACAAVPAAAPRAAAAVARPVARFSARWSTQQSARHLAPAAGLCFQRHPPCLLDKRSAILTFTASARGAASTADTLGAEGEGSAREPTSAAGSGAKPTAQASGKPARQRSGPLFSKKKSNTGILAGSISHRVRDAGDCEIYAVGALPCQNALKSIALATQYLEEWLEGKQLALTVEKRILPQSMAPDSHIGSKQETAVMCFHVRPAAAASPEEPEVFVAAETNPGVAAGLLRTLVQDRGVGSMTAMGERAINQAIKTLIITEIYLQEHLDGRSLAATPRFEHFRAGEEERHRMVLSCAPAPPRPTSPSEKGDASS